MRRNVGVTAPLWECTRPFEPGPGPRSRSPSPCRRPAHIVATPMPPPRRRSSWISVVTMRAPVAATGWPRLQPLPFTLTISWSKPRIRLRRDRHRRERLVDLHELDVLVVEPGAGQRLRHRERRAEAGVGRRHPRRRPRPHDRERLESVSGRVVGVAQDHRARGVVDARRVARGDREPGDLRVQHRQRGELLERGVATRVLVGVEDARLALPRRGPRRRRSLRGSDLRRWPRSRACASGTPTRPAPRA